MTPIPFDFGWRLGERNGSFYACPHCKTGASMRVDVNDPHNVVFSCKQGCTQKEILSALGYDPDALVHLQGSNNSKDYNKTSPKNRITWETLMCEMALLGWSVQFNLISQEIEVNARSDTNRLMNMDDLTTVLHSNLSGSYKGCTLDNLHAYTTYIARENSYNPVLDFLAKQTWDGEDRLPALYDLMGISEDNLSKVLVLKWLLQTVALLFNDESSPYGADGVLVLNGGQGMGKTSLFRKLALRPEWFREGATIKDNDKDTTRRCVTVWIAELGEVESTLKSDISALKAFITSEIDVYRPPYARNDRKVARRTSLCATCNSDRYLIDPTGNRRWWSVPVSVRMDYGKIQKFDTLQLWAQIYAIVSALDQKGRAACYRLTPSEQEQLAIRNGEFEKPLKGEMECRDLIQEAIEKDYTFELMTITQWRSENIDALRAYSVNQIGAALNHIGITMKRKRINGGNAERCYELPTRFKVPAEIRAIK